MHAALERLARHTGADLAHRAFNRGAERVRRSLIQGLRLEARVLTEPAEALARMEQALAQHNSRIGEFLNNFSYRLQGEVDRFSAALSQRAEGFIEMQESQAAQLAGAAVASAAAGSRRHLARRAEAEAWRTMEGDLRRWETELLHWMEDRQRAIAQRFTAEATQLMSDVQTAAPDLLGATPPPEAPAPRFAPVPRYYFAPDRGALAMDLSGITSRVLEAILPRGVRHARLRRVLAGQLTDWARHNATRAASEIRIATDDTRRVFEWEIEQAVAKFGEVASTALETAKARRVNGEASVAGELMRVRLLLARCEALSVEESAGAMPNGASVAWV